MIPVHVLFLFFFFNDTATTEIYTLSLHDALPISPLTFSQTVSVPLVDDSVPEITEDFNFNISNALGSSVLGTPTTLSVRIFDDDASRPLFSSSSMTVSEGGGECDNSNFPNWQYGVGRDCRLHHH